MPADSTPPEVLTVSARDLSGLADPGGWDLRPDRPLVRVVPILRVIADLVRAARTDAAFVLRLPDLDEGEYQVLGQWLDGSRAVASDLWRRDPSSGRHRLYRVWQSYPGAVLPVRSELLMTCGGWATTPDAAVATSLAPTLRHEGGVLPADWFTRAPMMTERIARSLESTASVD